MAGFFNLVVHKVMSEIIAQIRGFSNDYNNIFSKNLPSYIPTNLEVLLIKLTMSTNIHQKVSVFIDLLINQANIPCYVYTAIFRIFAMKSMIIERRIKFIINENTQTFFNFSLSFIVQFPELLREVCGV